MTPTHPFPMTLPRTLLVALMIVPMSAVAVDGLAPTADDEPFTASVSSVEGMADGNLLLAQSGDAPQSADELFGFDDEPADPEDDPQTADELFGFDDEPAALDSQDLPDSASELFGDETEVSRDSEQAAVVPSWLGSVDGFWQNELAYAYQDPEHYSKFKNHLRLAWTGAVDNKFRWKVSGHLIYDPVFEFENFYPDKVEDDQKLDGYIYETYADFSLGTWELRLGRQLIVWGEAVGLFFADVVSGLDLREFVLPEFELIRLPQWAARAEYFGENFYGEVVYIPLVTTDNIGEFGAEFYPISPNIVPPGVTLRVLDENVPRDAGSEFGFGMRGAYLKNGWDASIFYYTSPDRTAAFERRVSLQPQPTITLRPIHERIHQFGSTIAKDLDAVLLKAEAVYTKDRLASVSRLTDLDGLVETDELRYLVSSEWAIDQHRINVQFFQTWYVDHDEDMTPSEVESGFSVLLDSTQFHRDVTPEILWIRNLNRDEWLLQAKIEWRFIKNWRVTLGTDVFSGPADSLLGQYDDKDRVYYELRYSF